MVTQAFTQPYVRGTQLLCVFHYPVQIQQRWNFKWIAQFLQLIFTRIPSLLPMCLKYVFMLANPPDFRFVQAMFILVTSPARKLNSFYRIPTLEAFNRVPIGVQYCPLKSATGPGPDICCFHSLIEIGLRQNRGLRHSGTDWSRDSSTTRSSARGPC